VRRQQNLNPLAQRRVLPAGLLQEGVAGLTGGHFQGGDEQLFHAA
jgi:hypothetical protein